MRRIRKLRNMRMTPLTIIAVVVGSLLASGGAFATASTLITGKEVRDHSLTSKDVRNLSLHSKDFDKKVQKALKLRAKNGAAGATGAQGAAGARVSPVSRVTRAPGVSMASASRVTLALMV